MSAYGSGSGPEYLDDVPEDLQVVGRRIRKLGRLQYWPMGGDGYGTGDGIVSEDDLAEHIKRCPDPQCARCEKARAEIAADLGRLA